MGDVLLRADVNEWREFLWHRVLITSNESSLKELIPYERTGFVACRLERDVKSGLNCFNRLPFILGFHLTFRERYKITLETHLLA